MPQRPATVPAAGSAPSGQAPVPTWEPPRHRVIPLDCEITAYAPDDEPLF